MGAPRFRTKLILAMLGLVAAVSGTTLFTTQRVFESDYRQRFEDLFALQSEQFSRQQHWAMDVIGRQLEILVQKQRLQLALLESDADTLYTQVRDELVIRGLLPQQGEPLLASHVSLFVFLDAAGRPLLAGAVAAPGLETLAPGKPAHDALRRIGTLLPQRDRPLAAYLALDIGGSGETLHQAVFARVVDNFTGEVLGAFGLVAPVPELGGAGRESARAGVLFDGVLYSSSLTPAQRASVARLLDTPAPPDRDLETTLDGTPYRVVHRALESEPGLPPARLVALLSMSGAIAGERRLERTVLYLGAGGLLLALVLGTLLAHGLTDPIRDLVRGTEAIRRGEFEHRVPIRSRDELGQLSASFNDMAAGLAQREKLHNLLNMVADRDVAQELIGGNVALGGELREVSVLFCDIRGFTALSEGMHPGEVISMLNEHFTPLTRIVYEHHGVVDKFVGDLIMAIFGAPKSYGDDALNAARCALAMVRARRALNATSAHVIEIGIGVASGPAVAGCMGSADRLNYTVLGERVNLASRLCGRAGRMEVVVDAATHARVRTALPARPLGTLELKGFAAAIDAYVLLDPEAAPA
jgi:class 3 adenylate cyclase